MRFACLLLALAACAKPAAPGEMGLGPPPPAEVHRIVTLAPSLTDLVLALGAGERLVGVTRYDEAPEVQKLTRVGGYSDPSAETILHLKPDLVLCQPSPGNKGAVEVVANAGIPVRIFPLETLKDVTGAITRIGALLGRDERAKQLVTAIEVGRERARESAKARGKKLRVVVLFDVDPLIAAGPGSFPDELLTDAGAVNVVERAPQPFPQIPLETLLAKRPNVILVAPLAAHGAALAGLPDVLRPKTRELQSLGILRPGPLVVNALDELTRVLDEAAKASP